MLNIPNSLQTNELHSHNPQAVACFSLQNTRYIAGVSFTDVMK